MQRFALFGAVTLLLMANTACAASFDCAKATTKVEKMICANAELSKLDEELSKTYGEAIKNKPDKVLLQVQQRLWLKERNLCKDIACLRNDYQKRIARLHKTESYALVMSKDTKLCNAMLNLYNKDMNDYGELRYGQHKVFTKIKWQPVGTSSAEQARFDINNDGNNELVVKYTWGNLRGAPDDSLYFFPSNSDVLTKLRPGQGGLKALSDTTNKLDLQTYALKNLPEPLEKQVVVNIRKKLSESVKNLDLKPSIGGHFILRPLIFDEISYISMTDITSEWIVIGKYKQADEMQDICYFYNTDIQP